MSLAELHTLAKPRRALVVHHHQTWRLGGHSEEIAFWSDRLRNLGFGPVGALRAKPFSPRACFVRGGDVSLRLRASVFAERWSGLISWHPDA